MAEALIPTSGSRSWLDRPLAPSWQRLAALAARWELLAYGAIVLIGFLLRIWDLGFRALHHDESLHAYYAWRLFAGFGYSYDPLMHGPLKFEMQAFFFLLFGDSEFTARLYPALMGTALLALPYLLRRYLTPLGAIAVSLFLMISPTFLYFSRFIRDDVPLAFFTLLLFICVVRYLDDLRVRWVYIGAATMALMVASMEAAYLMFFIFGTFIIFEALREYLDRRDGPVLTAIKATSLDTWLTAVVIFVIITVLLYSTFFSNPYGIWDTRYSLTSPQRKDILGGLLYWQSQQGVARGAQPWYYYFLVLPLYEQIAVLFGVIGAAYAIARRSFVRTFLVWWAAGSLLLYSWAGEKMPWLSMHITLPLLVLAGLVVGRLLTRWHGWRLAGIAGVLALLLVLETHSAFALSFQDPANPTEMLIYVQTSQDVPAVSQEISAISHRVTGGTSLAIGLDDQDVGGWPFLWYLRDYPNIFETSTFSGPVCGSQYCPVLLMLGPEYDQYAAQLDKRYVVQRYRWNWWFPEDYKQWFPDHVGSLWTAATGRGTVSSAPVGTPTDWQHLWNWLVYRTPFGDRGARWLYFLVRKDLVPGAKYIAPPSTTATGTGGSTYESQVPPLRAPFLAALGASAGLASPRGAAYDRHGNLYVADQSAHEILVFGPNGSLINRFGTVGTGPGQFNQLDSPQDIAIGPDGNVYVADTWNQRIQVFAPDGTYLRSWGGGAIGSGSNQFYGPRSVAVSAGGRVYVADTGNERVQVFNLHGKLLATIGSRGAGTGQFDEPSSVAVAPNGMVYVADFWNQRIQEFTPGGSFVRAWSVPDWTPHSYDEPYLSVGANGNVYATEPQDGRVVAWTSTGVTLGSIGTGKLGLPIGVAIRPDGRVAVTDPNAARIDLFARAATHQ